MSKMLAIALPIVPGKEEQWKKFINDLNGKYNKDYVKSRKKLGVRERTFHQVTPQGHLVIVTLRGDDPEKAFSKFAETDDEFTNWFVKQVQEIHNMDLRQPTPGPLPEMVIDSKK